MSTVAGRKPLPAFRRRSLRRPEPVRAGFLARRTMNMQRRESLYLELSEFIKNGIGVLAALDEIRRVAESGGASTYGKVLADIRKSCISLSFAQAMAPYATQVERLVLAAGEREPVEALRRCARMLRLTREAASGAFSGLAYPVGLLNAAVFYIYGFATQMLPTFATMVPLDKLTGTGAIFASVAITVRDWIVPGYAVLAIAVALFWLSLPTWSGALRARLDLFFPWSAYRSTQGASFILSLSALIAAGQPLPAALETMAEGASPWLRERLLAARLNIKGGDANIGAALVAAGYNFPDPDLNRRLVLVSQFSNLDKQLESLATDWIDRLRDEFAGRSKRYGALAMILVLMTMAGIALGMLDIVQQFSTVGQLAS